MERKTPKEKEYEKYKHILEKKKLHVIWSKSRIRNIICKVL